MMYLQRFLHENVSPSLLASGIRIHKNCTINLLESEGGEHEGIYELQCQSERDQTVFYHVEIVDSLDGDVSVFCACPQYAKAGNCKHAVACIAYLLDTETHIATSAPVSLATPEDKMPMYNAQVYGLGYLNEWEIFRGISSLKKKQIIEDVSKKKVVTIESESENKSLMGKVLDKKGACTVWLERHSGAILAACTCGVPANPCIHTRSLLYYILKEKRNSCYLDTLRNTDAEKNALLATVGLSLEDEQANLFEFYFEEKDLRMKGRGNLIMKASAWQSGNYLQKTLAEKNKRRVTLPAAQADEYIFILRIHKDTPVIRWEGYGITGTPDKIAVVNKKLTDFNTGTLQGVARWLSDFVYDFTPAGVIAALRANGMLSNYYYNPIHELGSLSGDKYAYVKNALIKTCKNNIDKLVACNQFFSMGLKTNKPKPTDLLPLRFSPNYFTIHLQVKPNGKFVFITAMVKIENEILPITDFENYAQIMLVKAGTVYIADTETTWRLLQDFNAQAEIMMPLSEAGNLYKEYLLPLRKEISMELPEAVMPVTITPAQSTMALRLKEMEPNFLVLQPVMKYDGTEAELDGQDIETFFNSQLQVISRDDAKEAFLLHLVTSLHPSFAEQENPSYFYLTFAKALAGGWFFDAIKTLGENNIEIYGQKQLTKFKYNTNKPKLEIKGGSGIDWFDLKIEVSYGGQLVPLKALKQAILNQQDFVQLGDGTLGLLPEEWLKKFRSLFQLGNIGVEGELKVSKFHYTLIDELHSAITDESILAELALKKQQLSQLQHVQEIAVPKNIKATLRPYQLAGLNWFNQLHHIGWGGCLADDMGLGKTLQTLCYLQHLYNQNKKLKTLIVCPTSLIYNWQAELDKFTTGISYVIYHGGDRAFPEAKGKWNVIITSYGTMRNDIEKFSQLRFDVTVLDESQSIKNPTSLVTKAVALIQTKMRFILSGTPVQNNTYDLYAQLNFCNPGLLGNQEFFKAEFATLIDKYGDREKSEQLRKMVFPFILRRTKEQVAKDLPDKTETILYCEMGTYQQKVYDSVKEEYRLKILSKIEEQGLGKTAFVILEGLNKLRMICDCPSLIKDEEKTRFKQHSIKLDEMMREIAENISNHKMLVFSQFLGMLSLIKARLDADGIKYIYLDGSTPAKERGRLVDQFQTDSSIQIFLISLKAGGVGLNLTAADYVYVLDPWWNPAVEDQAIDRTHRIGQHKKIFAYKLICKNSIEEKIIQLQAKKKSLAKELITEDASFIKKLTKEDVEWLLN